MSDKNDLIDFFENDFLADIIDIKLEELKREWIPNNFNSVKNFVKSIENKDELSYSDFKRIQELSLIKGGFQERKFRKIIYEKLISNLNTNPSLSEETNKEVNHSFDSIISVDIPRSKINSFFDRFNGYNVTK